MLQNCKLQFYVSRVVIDGNVLKCLQNYVSSKEKRYISQKIVMFLQKRYLLITTDLI